MIVYKELEGDGDFMSDECQNILREADVVISNPPFSLFRKYVANLVEHDKDFLIIGSLNAITYKEFFPLLKNNIVRCGYKKANTMCFKIPDSSELLANEKVINGDRAVSIPSKWFTTFKVERPFLELTASYYDEISKI